MDTEHSLRAVLAQAMAEERPDALLVTGDLSHDPEPHSYHRFAAIVADYFDGPLLCLPGNHDLVHPMASLTGEASTGDASTLFFRDWMILGIDSHVDGDVHGHVFPEAIRALGAQLQEANGRHVLIAVHHPPIEVGSPWLDDHRIKNGMELLEWLSEHPGVKGMVFGHVHQIVESSFRHIKLLGTPSTCFQFAPGSRAFAVDDTLPGYRWLALAADGDIGGAVRRVADYPLHIEMSARPDN